MAAKSIKCMEWPADTIWHRSLLCPFTPAKVDESGNGKFSPAKQGCWIMQNSWGKDVGFKGIFFINRWER